MVSLASSYACAVSFRPKVDCVHVCDSTLEAARDIVASKKAPPERFNVKTIPKRGLDELRRRMTDACVARVKRLICLNVFRRRIVILRLFDNVPTFTEDTNRCDRDVYIRLIRTANVHVSPGAVAGIGPQ